MVFAASDSKKVLCLAVLERLVATDHSLARSHYWLTWGLLAAEFPPWPRSPLLSQPDPSWLPRWVHVDASLSADAGSTWISDQQESPPQAIQQNLPPSSWITRACHCSRLGYPQYLSQLQFRVSGSGWRQGQSAWVTPAARHPAGFFSLSHKHDTWTPFTTPASGIIS